MSAQDSLEPFRADALGADQSLRDGKPAKKTARLADLLPRLLSGLALMALALAAWWLGGDVFILTWLAAAVAVFWEWQSITGGERKTARIWLGVIALILVAAFASRMDFGLAVLCLGLASCCMAALASPKRRLWASGGLLYAGALIGSLCILGSDKAYGPRAVLWLFAIVWGTDIFAYFGGRLLGGPKIWPQISPGKTWSGTLIGISCGAVLGTFFGIKGLPVPITVWPVFALSLAAAAVSQSGDMFESWTKRQFGVKDSGHLIPGHGGLMDRLDGFIAAAFFAAIIGFSHGGPSLAASLFVWS
jgi:phosphatidate cytidylyltransferase